MDALRKEIDDEIKRTRLDKTRLYDLLSKIIDQCGGPVGEGSVGPPGPPGPPGQRDGRIVVRHNLPVPPIPDHPDGDLVLSSLDSHRMIHQVMSSKFPNCKISDWTLDEFDIAWPAEKKQRQKFMQYLVYIRLRERIFDHMQVFGKFQ